MAITLQHFTPQYQQQVQDFVLGIQNGEFHLGLTVHDQPDLPNLQAFYQERGGQFWIALDEDDTVVATIAVELLPRHNAVLRKMFVAPHLRGKKTINNKELNIAQTLFNAVLDFAREHNVSDLWLDTPHQAQAAHRFYVRNGFVHVNAEAIPHEFRLPNIALSKIHLYRLSL